MTKTARSIFAFGLYLLPLGTLILLAPNFFLGLFSITSPAAMDCARCSASLTTLPPYGYGA